MQALIVTHASRPFVEARASLNALESRFSAEGRLGNLPLFTTLPTVSEAVPFSGALTLWDIDKVSRKPPVLIAEYDPGYKIQSAVFRGDQLLVLGEDRIEVLTPGFRQKTIEDPWLVGGHTIHCDKRGFAYATSAPANAVLKIDIDAGKVVERIRMPDCYGVGYPLTENDDLRQHFVPTDLQPTHINCAVPCAEGLLVTLCIPGVVGVIGSTGRFREIVRGYRGCHGGRIDDTSGLLYFTDSAAGIVWFAGYETGQIASRIKIDSAWVHDADQIGKDLFAVALSDRNRVDMISRADSSVVASLDCHPFGASAMFVKATTLPAAWRPKRRSVSKGRGVSSTRKASFDKELLSDTLNPAAWMGFATVPASIRPSLHIHCDNVQYEYVAEGQTHALTPGEYVFEAEMVCNIGEASVGLLNETEGWIAQLNFDSANSTRASRFSIQALTSATVVVTGHNSRRACPIAAELKSLSLRKSSIGLDGAVDSTPNDDKAAVSAVSAAIVHRRAETVALQSEINKRDALLAAAQEGLAGLQNEINKRDDLLREADDLRKNTHDHLQAEVNKRDALLKEVHQGLERLQGEVNTRDDLLKKAHYGLEKLQAEVNSRDELLKRADTQSKEVQDQLQSEINKRDALLKSAHAGIEQMQSEIDTRDALLKKTESRHKKAQDLLHAEVTKRDALLKTANERLESLQAEVNKRDVLLVGSHEGLERLQTEVNTRDELLKTAQNEPERLQAKINKRDELLKTAQQRLEGLQVEVKKRDALLVTCHEGLERLQTEVNARDELLRTAQQGLEGLQAEVNKRDALLNKTERQYKKAHDLLQSEVNKRDALVVTCHEGLERLQAEVNARDELLKTAQQGIENLQAEINSRDGLLKKAESQIKKTHDHLQSEVNKRDELLKAAHDGLQSLQIEVNTRDALLKKTHDHLQAEINKRDQMLAKLQTQINGRS